jgi:hypothetical protein
MDASLYKMIGVMARELYKIEWPLPEGKPIKAAAALSLLADGKGITIDDSVALECLRRAAAVCAKNEKEEEIAPRPISERFRRYRGLQTRLGLLFAPVERRRTNASQNTSRYNNAPSAIEIGSGTTRPNLCFKE